jgi:hypothetical protein
MADIDVVKKSSHLWLWILLAVVIAVILWYFLSNTGGAPAQTGILERFMQPALTEGGSQLQV